MTDEPLLRGVGAAQLTETLRIEGRMKRLPRPILVSTAFARIARAHSYPLGLHPVRRLFEPKEVFGLTE